MSMTVGAANDFSGIHQSARTSGGERREQSAAPRMDTAEIRAEGKAAGEENTQRVRITS